MAEFVLQKILITFTLAKKPVKKFFATILALLYLAASIGATVHFHYCMDKLVAWGFDKDKTSPKACPYCGMEKSTADKHCVKEANGCCKDEQKQIQVDKDQKAPTATFSFVKPIFHLSTDYLPIDLSSPAFTSLIVEYPTSHAPPRTEDVSLFLRNCVFRI
jgi:hypothetical protein